MLHRRCSYYALVAMILLLARSGLCADLKFPMLTGRVVDSAGILSASTKSQLDAMLVQHEHSTGEQVVVVTLDSLQGHSIEDYGYQLGRYWGIGQKGKNNGVILIVAPHERKTRIEVGYGLEGRLTDASSRVIIETRILPRFRTGDFDAGVLDGTAAILRTLGDEAAANLPPASAPLAPDDASNQPLSPTEEILLLLFFLMMMYLVLRSQRRLPYMMRHGGPYGPYSGWHGGSFGGGSSGGGGFSGGGGSFGGGGASGGW